MSTYRGAWDRQARPKPPVRCCSECGRRLPKPQSLSGSITAPTDTARMTDAQLFAHYKRTALREDLAFFLQLSSLSPALRMRAEAISKPTAKDLSELRTAWRTERQTSDLERGIPSIGSPRWQEYQTILASEETVLAS